MAAKIRKNLTPTKLKVHFLYITDPTPDQTTPDRPPKWGCSVLGLAKGRGGARAGEAMAVRGLAKGAGWLSTQGLG